ncbi:MAG: hypothetical protein AAF960_23065 [Bacteroidota bacterium]
MKSLIYSFCALAALLAFSCSNPPDYPIEPVIEFISLSKPSMQQGRNPNTDSTLLTISFTDGDGDIGSDDSIAVFLVDMRDDFQQPGFRIPFVGQQGVGKGISGEIYIALPTSCCYYEDGRSPCEQVPGATDELGYELWITDRAGNESNHIDVAPIILRCD